MKEEPPLDYKCRDKFLVQSVALDSTPGPDDSLTTLWSSIEKTSKGSIQEKKIRVTFLAPSGTSTSSTNGIKTETDEKPPSYSASSPSPQFGSPAPTEKSVLAESAHSVAAAIPTSTEELKAQLAAAQRQIAKLTQDLKDPAVRQRKVAEAQEKVQTVVQQSQDGGVPLHIAAALCLVSFLIAYLFF
jgi:dsRNA-specific ribonuclease